MTTDVMPWLRVGLANGVGPVKFGELMAKFGSPEKVLSVTRGEFTLAGFSDKLFDAIHQVSQDKVEAHLNWGVVTNQHLITLNHPDYPVLLKSIKNPPAILYVWGDAGLLSMPQIAMVGARYPTHQGVENAKAFARFLASGGFAITSGLAQGIDAAAHQGALDVRGKTLAIVGTGLDIVYPLANERLAHSVIEFGGAIVSEFPLGTKPQRGNFPARNRIISGLSLGTLVVEAAQDSGSLISARHALQQSREVFAIPGSIHNPMAKGCHALIREGAKLVESGQDVVDELGGMLQMLTSHIKHDTNNKKEERAQTPPQPVTGVLAEASYQSLLHVMGHDGVTVDKLVEMTDFSADEVSSMLLILELEGHVSLEPSGEYCRVH